MIEYYTMESVRDFINGRYEVRATHEKPVPMQDWNRYPCRIIDRCKKEHNISCIGYVSIYVDTKTVRWLNLEICFFREKQRAFIRVDSLQMLKLFELGIIAQDSKLDKETF